MPNILRSLFPAWRLLCWGSLFGLGLLLMSGHQAAAQAPPAEPDEEYENVYAFAWPPRLWLVPVFYMAVPEPMSDKEREAIKAQANKDLTDPKASEKQKQRAAILLSLAGENLPEAAATVLSLRARYPDDPEFAWVEGVIQLMRNRPEEALKSFSSLSAMVEQHRNWQVFAKQSEAWALLALNRFDDAFETARNQVAKLQSGAALKSHQGWFTYYIYGQVWAHKGFNETALKAYRLARIRWIKGPDGRFNTTVGRYLNLQAGDGNMAARHYRNAQRLYLDLTLARRAMFGREHVLSLEAQHRLILAFFAIGDVDKAVELGDEFIIMAPGVFGPDSEQMLDIMTVMAKVAMLRDEWLKAETLLERTLNILQARPGETDNPALAGAYVQMGGLYLATGRPAKADDYFKRGYDLACGAGDDVTMAGVCLTASYQVALKLAQSGQKNPARDIADQAKKMAEKHKVATIYSEQYAVNAALAAELEKDAPQLADFKNLTIR